MVRRVLRGLLESRVAQGLSESRVHRACVVILVSVDRRVVLEGMARRGLLAQMALMAIHPMPALGNLIVTSALAQATTTLVLWNVTLPPAGLRPSIMESGALSVRLVSLPHRPGWLAKVSAFRRVGLPAAGVEAPATFGSRASGAKAQRLISAIVHAPVAVPAATTHMTLDCAVTASIQGLGVIASQNGRAIRLLDSCARRATLPIPASLPQMGRW
jgi:hypothetical protein